jgi:hypothetical protein
LSFCQEGTNSKRKWYANKSPERAVSISIKVGESLEMPNVNARKNTAMAKVQETRKKKIRTM